MRERRRFARLQPSPVAGLALATCVVAQGGCFRILQSEGGGQTDFAGPRTPDPSDVALPRGYAIEPVITGLTFPTDVTFDDTGRMYVLEAGYSYGNGIATPRLLRVESDGKLTEIARGDNPPWNGVDFADGRFYVAGGHMRPGEILEIAPDGRTKVLVEGLATSVGDHHTNAARIGPDGYVYFGQGPLTNSAVVGVDNYQFGWLPQHRNAHDIPCEDVELAGKNYVTKNPLTSDPNDQAVTGAYVPFGTRTEPGQIIKGQIPCGGGIFRVPRDGGKVELVAWGLRNPWGLAWTSDGKLYATENQFDVRGSRPVFGTGDLLWKIEPGTWYGWPDFWAGRPLTQEWFEPPEMPKDAELVGADEATPPGFLLAKHPGQPPKPAAVFGVHASANGIDISRSAAFGYVGQAFVAEFGDIAPKVGKVLAPIGYKVVRVDLETGVIDDFAINLGETNGPGSWLGTGGLERPVNVRFSPDGNTLYVVDFGVLTTKDGTMNPRKGTGVIWKIERRPS